ncbi:hypothetical protein ACFX2C_017360 [Malus domestica]
MDRRRELNECSSLSDAAAYSVIVVVRFGCRKSAAANPQRLRETALCSMLYALPSLASPAAAVETEESESES